MQNIGIAIATFCVSWGPGRLCLLMEHLVLYHCIYNQNIGIAIMTICVSPQECNLLQYQTVRHCVGIITNLHEISFGA